MAAVTSTIIAAAALGYAAYSGERSNSLQTQARRRQQAAQQEALRIQMIERQRSAQGEVEAAQRKPTTLTTEDMTSTADRTGGVDDRLRLSRKTALGGGS